MLFHPLDAALGTTTKVRVLRALLQIDGPVSGREARRLARVRSAQSMAGALDDLTVLGLLVRQETRGSHLYQVNRAHHLHPHLAGLFEAEDRRISDLRDWIEVVVAAASQEDLVLSVAVYGSSARGEAEAGSDLDLLVVTRDEAAVSPVRQTLLGRADQLAERMGLRMSPYVISNERAETRLREGDPLLRAIAEEGRVLLGDPLRYGVESW